MHRQLLRSTLRGGRGSRSFTHSLTHSLSTAVVRHMPSSYPCSSRTSQVSARARASASISVRAFSDKKEGSGSDEGAKKNDTETEKTETKSETEKKKESFEEKKESFEEKKESFEEMLKKVQGGGSTGGSTGREGEGDGEESSSPKQQETDYAQVASDLIGRGKYFLHTFTSGWGETWQELVSGPPEQIKKTVSHAAVNQKKKKKVNEDGEEIEENEEVEEAYTGPQAIVVTDSDKSTWESMQERLQDSPLIQEMLKNTRRFKKQAASTDIGQKVGEMGGNVQDKIHDAREFWETSQNPLVYKLSGAWESLTAPTEEGMAIAAIQKLDPNFILESWAEAIKTERSEISIRAHLEGNLKVLKPITGEGVYNKLAADIRTRKHDGIKIDTNILQMDELQVMVRMLDQEGPIILAIYMVQQINCIRNKEGEIIEGGESQVIAKYYTIAYKQVYDDDAGVSDWKIVDYHMEGSDQYY